MGLIRAGAPDDEYNLEVDTILSRLHEASSPNALGHIIYETFVAYFDSAFTSPNTPPSERTRKRFATLGEKVWASWKDWERETHTEK